MNFFPKPLLINFVILLLYSLCIGFYSMREYEGEVVLMVLVGIAVAVHIGILLLLAIYNFVKGDFLIGRMFLSHLIMVLFFAAIVTPLMLSIFH